MSLLGVSCVHAGDVAAVRASVCDIDAVDGQDAHSLCCVRQSFTMGLSVLQSVWLVRWNEIQHCIFTDAVQHVTNHCCYVPVCEGKTTECPLQRRTPPTLCSSGWGPPPLSARLAPQETAWHRKPDFLSGKEKKGGGRKRGTEGGETVREVTVTSSAFFFLPRRTRGNDFPLDQRSHPTIKKLSVTSSHYFHSFVKVYISEGN